MTLNDAGIILYVGECIGCLVFCVLYGLRSRFWKTQIGVNLFAMMFVLFVLQGLSLLRLVVAEQWFNEHQVGIRFWSFGALFVVVWWRVAILIQAQRIPDNTSAPVPRRQRETDSLN